MFSTRLTDMRVIPVISCSVKEEHGHPIYCVAFNFIGDCNNDIFASCGAARVSRQSRSHRLQTRWLIFGNVRCSISLGVPRCTACETFLCIVQATIYRCNAGGKIEIVQAYVDDDVRLLISLSR